MNAIIKHITSYILVLTVFSCEKTVNTFKPKTPILQVLSALQSCDSVAECYITKTNNINDVGVNYLINCNLFLYDNNSNIIDTLKLTNTNTYKGKVPLTATNQNYTIRCVTPNYPEASCIFNFPLKTNFTIEKKATDVTRITIDDMPGENFYYLQSFKVDSGEIGNYHPYIYIENTLFSDNDLFKNINTGSHPYNLEGLFFSDVGFDGTTFFFDLKNKGSIGFANPKMKQFVLKTISKEYYNFLTTSNAHFNAQTNTGYGLNYVYNLYPFEDVYSNIKGGVGIYATYNATYKKIILNY